MSNFWVSTECFSWVSPFRSHISARMFSEQTSLISRLCLQVARPQKGNLPLPLDRPPRTAAVIRSSLSWKWPPQTNLKKKSELQCHCPSTLGVIQPTATLAACCSFLESDFKTYFTFGCLPALTAEAGRTQRFNTAIGHDPTSRIYNLSSLMLSCHLTDFTGGNLLARILERKWWGVQMLPVQMHWDN